jgi:phosphatidylglycerophosphate synthase
MADYQPVSRRPIADLFRKTARWATNFCVRCRIHPDVVSYLSILAAGMAAVCFWKAGQLPILLIIAPLLCYLRLWFNMLDGMVAVAGGQASARGEILNDLPDRVSDLLIFAGVAHSGLMNPIVAYWAAICAVLTAYIGLFGQAVGVQREFSGLMSKPWRMVALHLGAWATFADLRWNSGAMQNFHITILDWTCLLIIAGCLQTMVVRLRRIMRALEARPK